MKGQLEKFYLVTCNLSQNVDDVSSFIVQYVEKLSPL